MDNERERAENIGEQTSEDADETLENSPAEDEEDDYGSGSELSADDFLDNDTFATRSQIKITTDKTAGKLAVKISLIAACVLVVAIAALYAYCLGTLPADTAATGMYIENINVSGMTYDEALTAISHGDFLDSQHITVSCNGQSHNIDGGEIGLSVNFEDTARKAVDYGKTGNKFLDAFTSMRLLVVHHKMFPSASVDDEKLKEKVDEFGVILFGAKAEVSVECENSIATVTPGRTGYDGDSEQACEDIKTSLKNERFYDIPITLAASAPEPLSLGEFDSIVYCDPENAYYSVEDNNVNIIEEKNGRYIDKEEAENLLQFVYEGGMPVEIPYYTSYADITSQTLKDKLFTDTMASYTTSYASSTSNRASNVARAASLINGTVIPPGGEFSFNNVVGKRTVSNGFSTAAEYVDGKTVDGIGGGTCQVSSTLYNAVLYADLKIVTRTNHMFSVAYVPNGQDATVADGGPDFKFMNNTEYPIKISATTGDRKLTVSIIGTGWDPKREIKINNSTSYSGTDTLVSTTRSVYSNGELVRTETMPSSRYKKPPENEDH